MSDLRKLLDKYRIAWKDRGANTSTGNINIQCPFCGSSDPSFHMAISELGEDEGWYCLRNRKHAGKILWPLFKQLRITYADYQVFVKHKRHVEFREDRHLDKTYDEFKYFDPAEQSEEAQRYLYTRLFTDPPKLCQQYNLRYAKIGKWAGRLIIPLTVGWTGRSMRPNIEPRYLSETDTTAFFYINNRSTSAIVLEGSLDAMRIASVTKDFDIIAKCRAAISAAVLCHLIEKKYMTVYNLPDGDVPFMQMKEDTKLISSYCTAKVKEVTYPPGIKDACTLTEKDTRQWVYGSLC